MGQLCSLSTQRWGEQGKVITAQFRGLSCYYGMCGEVDVTAARLPLQVMRLAGARCWEEVPTTTTVTPLVAGAACL